MDLLLVACTALTVAVYAASRALSRIYPSPFTTPVFFSTSIIVAVLLCTGLEYRHYEPAKNLMTTLLGPATVALALPIYKNWKTLRAYLLPGGAGIVLGSLATVVAAVALARLFELGPELTLSMSVKSVTAPVAVELAAMLRGNPVLAAGFVIATGMIGAMLGPWLLTRARIVSPVARGLALGTISHGQGTAQALTEGSLAGAMAGIAMGLSAVVTSSALPLLLRMLL